uniref:Uncharacterized protein n=1 Tax=Mus musculus TaxID=10090 RepID=Q78ZW7_MOUSE|nr:unknown [Mus musculus]
MYRTKLAGISSLRLWGQGSKGLQTWHTTTHADMICGCSSGWSTVSFKSWSLYRYADGRLLILEIIGDNFNETQSLPPVPEALHGFRRQVSITWFCNNDLFHA